MPVTWQHEGHFYDEVTGRYVASYWNNDDGWWWRAVGDGKMGKIHEASSRGACIKAIESLSAEGRIGPEAYRSDPGRRRRSRRA